MFYNLARRNGLKNKMMEDNDMKMKYEERWL